MFKELRLENFQSWKKQTFRFSPGVNVFIGKSDTGKSAAFLRAIRLLATNRPTGDDFISHWVEKQNLAVELVLDTGEIVFREKGKGTNLYGIGHVNGLIEDQEFAAFGKGIPEEVVRLLNLHPVNIQGQIDGPFMLNLSPGDAARELNKACKLEGIDRGISNSNKRVRKLEQNIESLTSRSNKFEEDMDALVWIEEAESKLIVLEEKKEAANNLLDKSAQLRGLIGTVEREEENVKQLSVILNAESLLITTLGKYYRLGDLIKKQNKLSNLYHMTIELQETVEKNRKLLKASGRLKELIRLHNEKEVLITKQNQLNYLVNSVEARRAEHKEAEERLERLEKEFHRLMPDVCPLCGKKK